MKNLLRELRAQRGWSQADLAQKLDVSRQSVNAVETGKFDPSLPLAFRIARVFDMSIESIFIDESVNSERSEANLKERDSNVRNES